MKQRDLLFAGLMLLAAPAFAQTGPGFTEPIFDPAKDAKVVFTQNFESNWEKWSTDAVDTIWKVEYYKNTGASNSASLKPWEEPQNWQRGIFRDTTILLTNGVVVCDNPSHKWAEKDATAGTIITDAGQEKQARYNALAAFGEADGGGNSYFKFTTDTAPTKYGSSDYSTSTNLAARYRRNLFVRGLDIEDNSSYRLTFYVKGKARQGHSDVDPYMVADVMRGYFHAEKPFSMGYLNDNANYKYNTKIEYDKDFFTGDWEKCTFMTYYLNDTIANYFVFVDGYWWAEDSAWFWAKGYKGNNTGSDLYYHVQPDKFFVRLGFSSNYSEFCVDNMSLTKSTIGGVEYYEHMLRVDFGWQTNLKDLAREAYAKTKIDAVEIPGKYFEVWGKSKITGQWEFTDIASAEYHGDGYMYMFTETYMKDGEPVHYNFNDYSQILVSFQNPTEPELQLKYTGSVFPKATDIEWIKKGKVVENFYNEEAHVNPFVFSGVYSMYDLPPVMQKAQYEEGSFGLSGDIREMKFKFSRQMAIDNPDNANLREKCIVYVGEEVWDRTWNPADSILTITRPSKYQSALTGDVEVEINNLFIPNTQRQADNVIMHYNFGAINRDLSSISFGAPIWDAKFLDETVNDPTKVVSPAGTAAAWRDSGRSQWKVFDGKSDGTNSARLYYYTDGTIKRALMLCGRNSGSAPAQLFLGYGDGFEINLTPGNYSLLYKAQCMNKIFGLKVYVYPYTADPRNVNVADKQFVAAHATFTKFFHEQYARNNDGSGYDAQDIDTVLTTSFSDVFNIEKAGRYIVEVQADAGTGNPYPSILFSNFTIAKAPVSYGPIASLNEAVAAAQTRAALATAAEKYAGAALNDLNAKIDLYKVGGTFSSNKPSDWSAATEATNKATEAMKLRMDTVDLVVKKAEEVAKKLTDVAADNANWAGLIAYQTLQRTKGVYDSYPYSTKTNADLTAFIKQMDNEMATLDLRVKNTKTFAEAMRKAKALIDAKEQESYQQYSDLKDEYEDKVDFDSIGTTDAALADAYQELWTATHNYQYAVGILNVATRGIKELAAMATSLGSTIGDSAVVKDLYQNLKTDDDYLAAIYKAAIKAAIYEKGASAGELDLSAFIKNYYMYATPIIADEMDVAMPETRDSLKYNVDRHGIANVGHTRHQYQSDGKLPIYTVLTQYPFTELIPGWTLVCGNGGGNDMLFLADMRNDSIYYDAVFDATLAMDWGGEADLTTYVLGLPAGEYTLGLDVHSSYDKYQSSYFGKTASTKGKGYLKVRPGGSLVEEKSVDVITGWLGEDSILVPIDTLPGQFTKKENDAKFDDTIFVSVDFTLPDLSEEKEGLKIHALLATDQGTASFGDFKLTFKPSATFDYAGAVAAAKADVAKIITVVDINKAQNSNVEFYTLGGLKVDGAKSGQVLIRKTTNANGKVSFDKVLLK